jgi:AcrR family transcriptional regulator
VKETKEKIIRQALEYFTVNDYQGASLNSIAKSIGITKGGIYHYFESKEDLYKECILYFFDVLNDLIEEMIGGDFEISVEDFIAGFFTLDDMFAMIAERLEIDLLKDYLNYVYLMFLGLKKFPELKMKMSEIYSGSKSGMQFQLENYQKKGLIREDLDCENFAIHILALSEGLMLVASVDTSIDFKKAGAGIIENLVRILK